jgi:hypothetical protein
LASRALFGLLFTIFSVAPLHIPEGCSPSRYYSPLFLHFAGLLMAFSFIQAGVVGVSDTIRQRAVQSGCAFKSFTVASALAGLSMLPLEATAEWCMPIAPADMRAPPHLFNTATRKSAKLPHDVVALAAPQAGGDGHFPACTSVPGYRSRWGLLHVEKGWTITPQVLRAANPPIQSGSVVAAQREGHWQFFDTHGEVLPSGSYRGIALLSPGLWLAHPDAGAPMLLDGNLELIHTLTTAQFRMTEDEGWHYTEGKESTVLANPAGSVHVLPLRNGRVKIHRGYAWVFGSIVQTPDGAEPDADTAKNDHASEVALFQIYGRDGRALLDDATVAALRGNLIDMIYPDYGDRQTDKDMPLAVVQGKNFDTPISLLTAAGMLVTNEEWHRIETYRVTMPLLAITKDRNVGAIAPDGSWAVQPLYRGMNKFSGSYTWAFLHQRKPVKAVLIDARGEKVAVPAMVMEGESFIEVDLLRFRATDENRLKRWGIWDIRKGALVIKPVHEDIQAIDGDWAMARHKGRWGVVNREGRWVIPATHDSHKLQYLGQGMMSVSVHVSAGTRPYGRDTEYHLVNLRTGRASEAYIDKPDALKNGLFLGRRPDGTLVLLDSKGRAKHVSDRAPKTHEQFGDWFYTSYEKRHGAADVR